MRMYAWHLLWPQIKMNLGDQYGGDPVRVSSTAARPMAADLAAVRPYLRVA
jgi:hypothetical protein